MLAMMVGALAVVAWPPAARHAVDDEQTTLNRDALEVGRVIALKELPPSVVSTASPGALEFSAPNGFGPTATHWVEVAHEIDVN